MNGPKLWALVGVLGGLLGSGPQVGAPGPAAEPAEIDATPGLPFKSGDNITIQNLDRIKNYLPAPFWEHRDYFFYEGMRLEIGEFHRDYSPSSQRRALTEKYRGQARVGRAESLENYTLGQPFPGIDPNDPRAGIKHAWNFNYRHDAIEGRGTWYFSYWIDGEQLPLWYKGRAWAMRLAYRTDRAELGGMVFPNEKRYGALRITVTEPPDQRDIDIIGYRYISGVNDPPDVARDDDAWAWIPDLRRVRRFSGAQRNDAIAGTDMTPDDAQSFGGLIPQHKWKYIGEQDVLTPIDTRRLGYPLDRDATFGPSGFSFADDVWQLRRAVVIEYHPKEEGHIYQRKTMWLDAQSYTPLFAAAYDDRGELWKLIYHVNRWSEGEQQGMIEEESRSPVKDINAFYTVGTVLVNVLTGTGNRIEVWDAQATRVSPSKIRKITDIGRLGRKSR